MLLAAVTLSGFLGFLATELGWITTEEGVQPWVAQGLMRTSEGFNLAPGIWAGLDGLVALYLFLSVTLVWLLKHIADGGPSDKELEEERSKEAEEGAYAL